jgi:hypothetical protein
MPATLHRLHERAAAHNQAAPSRLGAANGDANAEPMGCRGFAKARAAAGRSAPKPRFSWIKLAAWGGLLLSSLFLWWVILRAVIALIALIR